MKNIIFLDVDGVFNCQIYYEELLRLHPNGERPKFDMCRKRIEWFSELCADTDSAVVISSTWRMGRTLEELQEMMNSMGGTFKIIGATPILHVARGVEIKEWLSEHCMELFGVHYFDFFRYAIIDDDDDMLLGQGPHFFQTDPYSGLTPTTCEKVQHFFTHKLFDR